MPQVSVVMPVYNAEAYLKEAIESILHQTFKDFELLVFNDGSTDASASIVQSYGDSRIRFFDRSVNVGYVHLLNEGIALAQGKYIARMDADDVSYPERLQQQVAFMESHSEVVLCGTRYIHIGKTVGRGALPCEDEAIRIALLHNNVFAHPSVMLRRSILELNRLQYPIVPIIEDYALWIQLAALGKFANLPDYLIGYRDGVGVSSKKFPEELLAQNNRLKVAYAKQVFQSTVLTTEEIGQLSYLLNQKKMQDLHQLEDYKTLIHKVLKSFRSTTISQEAMTRFLKHQFYYACTLSAHLGPAVFYKYIRSGLIQAPPLLLLKMALKSFFYYHDKPSTAV